MKEFELQPTCVEHITRIYSWESPCYQHLNWWLKIKGHSFRYKGVDGFVYSQLYAFLKKNCETIALELAADANINFTFKEFEWLLGGEE